MTTWILGLLLASVIGISLGLIGGGGSVLALPILVYVMGVPTKSAIAMTLVIVGSVSLLGSIPHWQRGYVNLRLSALFGSATMVGAFLGAKVALLPGVTSTFQMLLFATIMLLAAVTMIRPKSRSQRSAHPHRKLFPLRLNRVRLNRWIGLFVLGIGVGILTGLVGVGGGFMIVPALVLLGQVPIREAIGTSLLVIFLNSTTGFLGYLGQVTFDWPLAIAFTVIAGCGTVVGALLSRRIDGQKLQQGFGYFLIAVAAFILFQNRAALMG